MTPICDRGARPRAALQRDFVDGVAAPLLRAAAALLPGLQPHLRRLEENRRRWEDYPDEALLRDAAAAAAAPAAAAVAVTVTGDRGRRSEHDRDADAADPSSDSE